MWWSSLRGLLIFETCLRFYALEGVKREKSMEGNRLLFYFFQYIFVVFKTKFSEQESGSPDVTVSPIQEFFFWVVLEMIVFEN